MDTTIVTLIIDGEVIYTTPWHPFYSANKVWVNAGDLTVGDSIYQADGTSGVVESIEVVQRPQVMYDLTVDTAHTFFVGDQQWLAHNCSKQLGQNMQTAGISRPLETAAHHIVAQTSKRAQQARNIIQSAGVAIDDAINGVFLPKNLSSANPNGSVVHSVVHTRKYYSAVTSRLANRGKLSVQDVLKQIATELANGTFTH